MLIDTGQHSTGETLRNSFWILGTREYFYYARRTGGFFSKEKRKKNRKKTSKITWHYKCILVRLIKIHTRVKLISLLFALIGIHRAINKLVQYLYFVLISFAVPTLIG